MKILKFGGTSVGSVESISRLLTIVNKNLQQGEKLALVCSALSKVTDTLLKMVADAKAGRDYQPELQALENRHYELVRAFLEVRRQNTTLLGLKMLFNELEDLLAGVKALGEISPRVQDRLASYGERCSSFMISHFVDQHCGKAFFADARQFIKTDSAYGNARVNDARTNHLIQQFFAEHPDAIPVITGFIASNEQGDTTTLGRGGSDYTAALIGGALEAEEIQIWTDVDGFMTCDPRLVRKAFSLKQLSYNEAIELSYFGAKVIHPPTMRPAIAKNIPIVIRNTFNPAFAGTVIGAEPTANGSLIKGISSIPAISLVNIQGSGMVGLTGFSGRLFTSLARWGVNVILITQASSEHSITLAISPLDVPLALQAIAAEFEYELIKGQLDKPEVEHELSIIAAVGENMRNAKGLAGKFFSALGRSGVNINAIAQGSSELNISVVIEKQDLHKALNSVHDALFLSHVKTLHVFSCGTGKIGSTLLRQIQENYEHLEGHRHVRINLAGVCNTKKMLIRQEGIDLANWKDELQEKGEQSQLEAFITQAVSLNLPNSVFIDNTASAVVPTFYEELFKQSFSVVTCNKIGNSGTFAQYLQHTSLARKYGVDYWYETTAGAGLPIIKTLHDLLISGDEVLKIEAILSGTISFIFNEFKGSRTFAEVVGEAQEKGFTEPDPRDDLSGLDFARKMLILARETGLPTELEDVEIQPILPERCRQAPTVEAFYHELKAAEAYFVSLKDKAAAENKVLRMIGVLENGAVRVELKMVGMDHPFYSLSGSDNIVSFTTNRYRSNPMVIKGPGAGAEVTAAGVLADLVRVAPQ